MATHRSAEKRARQNAKRSIRNKAIKSAMKTRIKALLSGLETRDKDQLQPALRMAISSINKAASKGVIHKKTASRKISRLTKVVNKYLTT